MTYVWYYIYTNVANFDKSLLERLQKIKKSEDFIGVLLRVIWRDLHETCKLEVGNVKQEC